MPDDGANSSNRTSGPDAAGSPEKHWVKHDPEDQPSRDLVIGLRRMVIEAKDRLGPAATPEAIAAELKARGVDTDPADVQRELAKPY